MKSFKLTALTILCSVTLSACGAAGNMLNPFYETPGEIAYKGQPNDHALKDGAGGKEESARAALEHMASYQRSLDPQPVHPVVQPAVVRLMWVPDHLNKHGDLVPAHYYYLKVLSDRFAVQDAFELEGQLKRSTGGGGDSDPSNVPYVLESESKIK